MKVYRYTSTDCFKNGESVWITGLDFTPAGRTRYVVKPIQCKIIEVATDYIVVDNTKLPYYAPNRYYLDGPQHNIYNSKLMGINSNVAKTKEEAIKNYNFRIEEEIEDKYERFRTFEISAKGRLL